MITAYKVFRTQFGHLIPAISNYPLSYSKIEWNYAEFNSMFFVFSDFNNANAFLCSYYSFPVKTDSVICSVEVRELKSPPDILAGISTRWKVNKEDISFAWNIANFPCSGETANWPYGTKCCDSFRVIKQII